MEKVKSFEVSSRFYNKKSGKLVFVKSNSFGTHQSSINEAQYNIEEFSDMLHPCNISVRGKGGRFVKWRNK